MDPKDVRRRASVASGQKTENPTESNGQTLGSTLAYENPAISVSSTSINHLHRRDSGILGSNNFLVVDQTKSTFKEKLKKLAKCSRKKCQHALTKKTLFKRLPVLSWLPNYKMSHAVGDLVAGITVGLTLIPQGLAYAGIAGLPPEYGLYGSFLGCFIYIVFGSCKDVSFGPTAISSLLTFQATNALGPEHAILLCFFTGLLQIVMGLFGLGFLIDFVSGPVSSGFTSACALIIVTSQVRDVLGITASGTTFIRTWRSIFQDIHNTQPWDAVMGISCIVILLIMRFIGSISLGPKGPDAQPTTCHKILNKFLWFIGTARNAILVILCAVISYILCLSGPPPFVVIGDVPPGLPSVKVPPFGGFTREVNGTEVEFTFWDMMGNLESGIIVMPLLGLLETIAICKAFSNGKPVDATQELYALGFCNFANSFVQGFPGAGALARSAVNNASGVRTTLGGLYTGILVIASLLVFTPYFYYIPKACLGGIIIAAVIFMVEFKVIKPMWRSKKSCFVVALITFIACLVLPLEIGILVGIGVNLLFILYHAARPKISVEKLQTNHGTDYLLLTPDRCLIFPSVDYVRNLVTKQSLRQGIPVVIDCTHIYGADYTAAIAIDTITQDFASRDQPLLFYNLKPSVCTVFEGLSPKDFIVFYNEDQIDDLLIERNSAKKHNEILGV
uniref:Sodium-independent sulfate anion transporter n=1 Tax=Anoplophora glabripennis TaxID=217634 RepID=V5H1U5_ANOGL